ncbi:MAG: type II toxin-antitoxin system PemK/MazF family toxin [Candidatus Hydrogenedentes bacterium]|nr:type II toxin-antitoxin system PemK/MazF family toxin [Candidatus Hydrogenedentota bacterium]
MPIPLNPGDIFLSGLQGAAGKKIRPVVILSSPGYHRCRPDVIVGAVTTNLGRASTPSDYALLDWAESGLDRPSAFRSFVTTLARNTLGPRLGRLSERDWLAVQGCLKFALAGTGSAGLDLD